MASTNKGQQGKGPLLPASLSHLRPSRLGKINTTSNFLPVVEQSGHYDLLSVVRLYFIDLSCDIFFCALTCSLSPLPIHGISHHTGCKMHS